MQTDAATQHRQEGGIYAWLVEAVRTRRLHQLQTHTQYAAAAPTTGPFYPLGPWQPQRHQMTSIDDDLSPEKQWDDSVLTWSLKSQRHSRVSLTDVQEKWTFFSSLTTTLWCHLWYVMGTAEKGYSRFFLWFSKNACFNPDTSVGTTFWIGKKMFICPRHTQATIR